MNAEQVRFFPAAAREVDDAFAWYLERSPRAAEGFLREVDSALQSLAAFPRAWPVFDAGARRCVLRNFPYSVIYLERDNVVDVVAVAHHKRRPSYWRERLAL